MKKDDIKQIIEEYGLYPNKKLGQNFLISKHITDKIIDAVRIHDSEHILEIGPGLGALTEWLLESGGILTVIEIDSGFVRYLHDRFSVNNKFKLIHADFLRENIADEFIKIISNLPYYCSSEILFKIAQNYHAKEIYVMLQKEMAERIISGPGNKNYGALSVTLGFYYEAKILFKVSKESFYPRPEVDSSFLLLRRREGLQLKGSDINMFHNLVKSAFWGRRKTLLKALSESPHVDFNREMVKNVLDRAGIEANVRGEELKVDDYVRLTKLFCE